MWTTIGIVMTCLLLYEFVVRPLLFDLDKPTNREVLDRMDYGEPTKKDTEQWV